MSRSIDAAGERLLRGRAAPLEREHQVQAKAQQGAEAEGEIQRLRADAERQRQENANKVAQLNERIRDLNQRLLGTGASASVPAPAANQGFFKR